MISREPKVGDILLSSNGKTEARVISIDKGWVTLETGIAFKHEFRLRTSFLAHKACGWREK